MVLDAIGDVGARSAATTTTLTESSVGSSTAAKLPAGYDIEFGDQPLAAAKEAPTITVRSEQTDAFIAQFGASSGSQVLEITAPTQPVSPVKITIPYDPDLVPIGGQPSIFYFDIEFHLWIPMPTTISLGSALLVTNTDHFTDFTAGILSQSESLDTVTRWTDWLSYQVADLTGARTGAPRCGDRPAWVTQLTDKTGGQAQMTRNRPLLACVGTAGTSLLDARLSITSNRAYGFVVSAAPAPARIGYAPTPKISDAASIVLAAMYRRQTGLAYLPAGEQIDLDFIEPTEQTSVLVTAEMRTDAFALDIVTILLQLLADRLPSQITDQNDAYECLIDALQVLPGPSVTEVSAGAWADTSTRCLSVVLEPGPGESAGRFLKAAAVGLIAGQVGQSILDRERDLIQGTELRVTFDPATSLPSTMDTTVTDIVGRWTGPITQPGSQPYSIDVTVSPYLDAVFAVVDYPGLGCSGEWRYLATTSGSVQFEEYIDNDPEQACVSPVPISLRLTPDGRLVIDFDYRGGFSSIVDRDDK